jgi:hypothetical protein
VTSDDALIQVLSAVGELKSEVVGLATETRASFLAVTRRLDIANGRLAKGEVWMSEHDGIHTHDTSELNMAEAYTAGRDFERQRAMGFVQRGYGFLTHPLVLAVILGAVGVAGWILGALR